MKTVVINLPYHEEVVHLRDVPRKTPIFARKSGKLVGMLVRESNGWIVRIGTEGGACGFFSTKKECIEYGTAYFDYTFHIE